WNQWLPWTQCTLSCGGGTHFRLMVCANSNGSECTRDLFHTDECNAHQCPIDGYWSSWQPWTPCSATCGDGVRRRIRSCIGPLYGGRKCNEDDHESLLCFEENCEHMIAYIIMLTIEYNIAMYYNYANVYVYVFFNS
ncbi:hypothetical protein CAPTEDRAFT_116269, partial [Capitella teleta]